MSKKYFITANTYNIKEFIQPKDVKYVFFTESANHTPTCNLSYDVDFTSGFYQHTRYYEVKFNENGAPKTIEALDDGLKDFGLCSNGWFDFNSHLSKTGYNCWFLEEKDSYYFNSIEEVYRALNKWAKEVAEYKAKELIIEALEEEKEKLPW